MNRNQILVRNIKHLTDARYFAAMGVDWMSIVLTADPKSFALWHTLKDWIEGVKLAAEIDGGDEMLLAKTIIDAVPDGIILSQRIIPDIPGAVQVFVEIDLKDIVVSSHGGISIVQYDPLSGESLFSLSPNQVYLEATWTLAMLKALLDRGYEGGICFTGGAEETTGVKDYEKMDELIGMLQYS